MVKVGDKVRFLNAVGGGEVTKVEGRIATVRDDDGFEIPSVVSELVVVDSVNSLNFPTSEPTAAASKEEPTRTVVAPQPKVLVERPDKEQITLHLAFVPCNMREIQTTRYELYLINDSNYCLSYALYATGEEGRLLASGELQAQSELYVQEVKKEEVNDFRQIRLQCIATKAKPNYTIKPVFDVTKQLNVVKLYKLHLFTANPYLDKPALLLTLIERDYTDSSFEIDKQTAEKFFSPASTPATARSSKQERAKRSEQVFDLHISALLDTTAGMSNADMLRYQLSKFEEAMNAHLGKKGTKLIFIHGKGNGVLRKEIEKLLKYKYKSCTFQDASFQEYGFGATQVTIR